MAGIKYHDSEELQKVDPYFFLNSKGFDGDFSLKVPEFLLNNKKTVKIHKKLKLKIWEKRRMWEIPIGKSCIPIKIKKI